MIWEALGSVLIGFAAAFALLRLFPDRFPSPRLTLLTGPAASLLGGLMTRVILGPGNALVTLIAAAGVGAALLSLLVRDPGGRHGTAPRAA